MDTLKTTLDKVRNNVNIPIVSSSQLKKLSTPMKLDTSFINKKAVQVDHRNKKELVDIDNIPNFYQRTSSKFIKNQKKLITIISIYYFYLMAKYHQR